MNFQHIFPLLSTFYHSSSSTPSSSSSVSCLLMSSWRGLIDWPGDSLRCGGTSCDDVVVLEPVVGFFQGLSLLPAPVLVRPALCLPPIMKSIAFNTPIKAVPTTLKTGLDTVSGNVSIDRGSRIIGRSTTTLRLLVPSDDGKSVTYRLGPNAYAIKAPPTAPPI